MQTVMALEDEKRTPGKLYKLSKFISQIPEKALLVIMGITLLDMLVSVISRYILGRAVFWAEEVGTFGLVWMTMIGAGVAVKRGIHFYLPTILERLPSGARYVISMINHLLVIVFGLLMILTGWELTRASFVMMSPALEVNLGIINSSAIVGGALILIYEIGHLMGLIAKGSE